MECNICKTDKPDYEFLKSYTQKGKVYQNSRCINCRWDIKHGIITKKQLQAITKMNRENYKKCVSHKAKKCKTCGSVDIYNGCYCKPCYRNKYHYINPNLDRTPTDITKMLIFIYADEMKKSIKDIAEELAREVIQIQELVDQMQSSGEWEKMRQYLIDRNGLYAACCNKLKIS